MAMDGTELGNDMYDALVAARLAIEDTQARNIWKNVIGPKIVDHIKDNAEITIPVGFVSQGASPSVIVNTSPITGLTIE